MNELSPALIASFPRTQPLLPGTLVRRYKRFLADVELDSGEIVVAHCVNTGAMEGLTRPGLRVWLSRSDNPARKLAYTWELAEVGERTWGVNTSLPNRLVKQLISGGHLPWLADWQCHQAERKYGVSSRVDFWLCDYDPPLADPVTKPMRGKAARAKEKPQVPCRQHFLEVKNCHLVYPDGIAYFPDCRSERATAHLHELINCVDEVGRVSAEVLFVVQVPGAKAVRPSDLHDPVFAASARTAAQSGVTFSAIGVSHTPESIDIYGPLPVDLAPYATAEQAMWRERGGMGDEQDEN